jgi:hypothetical protein
MSDSCLAGKRAALSAVPAQYALADYHNHLSFDSLEVIRHGREKLDNS